MGYGESYIVNRLKPTWPDVTREKVRTLRLAQEGRTHMDGSVKDQRDAVITQGASTFIEAAVEVVEAWRVLHALGEAGRDSPALANLIARLMELESVLPEEA